jgi:hypothetical protein
VLKKNLVVPTIPLADVSLTDGNVIMTLTVMKEKMKLS